MLSRYPLQERQHTLSASTLDTYHTTRLKLYTFLPTPQGSLKTEADPQTNKSPQHGPGGLSGPVPGAVRAKVRVPAALRAAQQVPVRDVRQAAQRQQEQQHHRRRPPLRQRLRPPPRPVPTLPRGAVAVAVVLSRRCRRAPVTIAIALPVAIALPAAAGRAQPPHRRRRAPLHGPARPLRYGGGRGPKKSGDTATPAPLRPDPRRAGGGRPGRGATGRAHGGGGAGGTHPLPAGRGGGCRAAPGRWGRYAGNGRRAPASEGVPVPQLSHAGVEAELREAWR